MRIIYRHDKTGDKGKALDAAPYQQRFIEAMDDDFNTARARGVLFELASAINQAADSKLGFKDAKEVLLSLSREVLGLKLTPTKITTYAPDVIIGANPTPELEERVNRLVEERVKCRKEKNWQRADEIRKKLAEIGVDLEDTPQETKRVWRRTPPIESLDSFLKELGIDFKDTP